MTDEPRDGPDADDATDRRRGRPALAEARREFISIRLHPEERRKLHLLSQLHHGISLSVMIRDIVLDEVNAMLSDSSRAALVKLLRAAGVSQTEIETLLASL